MIKTGKYTPSRMGGEKVLIKAAKEEQAFINLEGWFKLLKKLKPISKKVNDEVERVLSRGLYDEMIDKAYSIQRMVDKI